VISGVKKVGGGKGGRTCEEFSFVESNGDEEAETGEGVEYDGHAGLEELPYPEAAGAGVGRVVVGCGWGRE
jgi:hypothetical protein